MVIVHKDLCTLTSLIGLSSSERELIDSHDTLSESTFDERGFLSMAQGVYLLHQL